MAAVVLLRDKNAFVHRVFAAGMFLLAAEELCRLLSYRAVLPADVLYWERRIIAISAMIPGVWFAFSISYARVNSSKSLSRWKAGLIASVAAPAAFVLVLRKLIFTGSFQLQDAERWMLPLDWAGRILEYFFLLASILILFNLERTIHSSTGRMRWQIKFMVLGVGGLFALKIYVTSQFLLYSRVDTGLGSANSVALIAANLLFALSIFRARSLNVDVYLSRATIEKSLTIIVAGVYLLSVGLAANLARSYVPSRRVPLDVL